MKSSRDRSRRTLQVVPIGVSVLLLIECVGTSAGSRSGDPVREPRLAKHPFQFEATEGAFTYSQFGSSDFPVIEGDCVLQQRTCCGHELWRGTVRSASAALDREWSDKRAIYFRVDRSASLLEPQLEVSSDGVNYFTNGWAWLESLDELPSPN